MKLRKALGALAIGLSALTTVAMSAPSMAADLVMWERSGGNKGMVDTLVAMWNAKNPDRKINLTYIRTPRWWRSWRRPSPPATSRT